MRTRYVSWLVALAWLATVVAVAGPAAGTPGPVAEPSAMDATIDQTTPNDETNDTTRHVNPETVEQAENLTDTRAWLAGRIVDRLEGSSINLSRGQYEQATDLVGSDLESLLDRYVDVAGETDSGDEVGSGTVQRAVDQQRRFTNETRRYDRLFREYQRARRTGDEGRAREIAQRLQHVGRNVTATGRNLTRSYGRITVGTDVNATRANRSVDRVLSNVTTRQMQVRNASFLQTSLAVIPPSGRVSFASPTAFQGRLVAGAERPVANRTITLEIGPRKHRVETDHRGNFDVSYRPVLARVANDSLPIRYIPDGDVPYLGASVRVDVGVAPTEPTVILGVEPGTVGYRDRVAVRGQVTAANASVPDLPLDLRLGSAQLGTVRTDEDGRFAVTGRLPASVADGTANVTATVAVQDRAISRGSASTGLTIESRGTNLTVSASRDGAVSVGGRLTTANGRPVSDRRIRLTVDGRRIGSARTDADGRYATTVELPATVDATTRVQFVARFAMADSNLENASAAATLQPPAESDGRPVALLATGVVGSIVALVGGLWLRRRGSEAEPVPSEPTADAPEPGDVVSESDHEWEPSLEQVQSLLVDGEIKQAVERAYAAVRAEYETGDGASTHWEFYRALEDELAEEDRARLRALTRAYEQAVFSETTDRRIGERALSSARELLED